MSKHFTDELLEYYVNNEKDIEKLTNHFVNLGYTKKKIQTTLSDLRRIRNVKITYKREHKNRVYKPNINYNILLLDIEISPSKAYVWSRWNNNIYGDQMINEWFMLSWAAKWLNSETILSDIIDKKDVKEENDKKIVESLYELMKKAKIIIAHNGKNFDCKKINTRFLYHSLPPLDFKLIDTLQVARSVLGNSSNSLDDLVKYFKLGEKSSVNFKLWKECVDGNKESLDLLREYNVHDTELLERLYIKLKPYIKNHPNIGNITDNYMVCASCGSYNIEREGYYYTNINKFPKYRCKDCGGLSRSRENKNSKEKMKNLLVSI